jgi:hypothetical protein
MHTLSNILKIQLKPIYRELLSNLEFDKEIFPFCVQWGKEFMKKDNTRILFVGKATNGWVTNSKDVDVLFGTNKDQIFDRKDQMDWVTDLKGNKNGYNTNKSAFWRVIIKTSQNKLGDNGVISKIAWSNLYKISVRKGNPTENLKRKQIELCKEILTTEIKLLMPKYVVFLTSGWENPFLKNINNGTEPKSIKTIKWGGKYYSKSYFINGINYITTPHPQGKNEGEHTRVLNKLIT